jgi:hypothetical protein
MIIVKIIGGLGNQLFQYALGRNLALMNNTELKLDISGFKTYKLHKYGLHHFKIIEKFATREDLHCIKMPSSRLRNFFIDINCSITGNKQIFYKKEPRDYIFDLNFFKYPNDLYLEGYWQSEKYFKNVEDIIRQEFSLKKEPDAPNALMAENILESDAISVHVRRGDYVANPLTYNHHGVCSLEYYHKAIDCMVKKISDPHFYFFSDDPAWVKKNLVVDYPHTYVTHNQTIKNYSDLWLMSLCKHHIIANSSFSWWGAWLSTNPEKMVIAPKKWVNNPHIETRDLFPEAWHTI